MQPNRTISLRAPLLYLLVGMIIGYSLAEHFDLPPAWLILGSALLSGLTLIALNRKDHRWTWYPLFLLAASLGFWAYGLLRLAPTSEPEQRRLPLRESTLNFQVERILQPEDRYGRTTGVGSILDAPATSRLQLGQRIYFQFKADDDTSVARGVQLHATGLLQPIPPRNSETSQFETYLLDSRIQYRFKRIHTFELLRPASAFDQFCLRMNARFTDFLSLGAPQQAELTNVYTAMLLGRKIDLTKAQTERFRLSGTMHFFAISGLHVGVIAAVIAQALTLFRVPRQLAPIIGLSLLYLYVEITGAPPSAMRAFLMTAFFWLSIALNRQRSPLPALVGSAVFVLLISPEQMLSIGFQLSYIVVLSILLFGLPLYEALRKQLQPFRWLPPDSWTWKERSLDWIIDRSSLLFAISFAAWISSTPLSAGYFDFIAPGAILLNMILVNLVALVIISGVLSLTVATLGLAPASSFLNHAAWLNISIMDTIIKCSLSIPGIYIESVNFPLWLSYLSLILFFSSLFWLHHQRRDPRRRLLYLAIAPMTILLPISAGLLLS